MVRAAPLGVAVLLLLVLLPPVPSVDASTTRTLVISTASAHPTVPFQAFDGSSPKVFDVDGDGRLEIIAQNNNQWVYVLDAQTGAILFEAKTTLPAGWGARSINGPEVAVMDQDGTVRLVVANSAATVTSFRFLPEESSGTDFRFAKEWERRLTDCFDQPGMDAKPVLADLTADGRMEILAATEEFGVYALRADGSMLWKNCVGGGNAEPGVADLNLDGLLDVVHVTDTGVVAALNGQTGGWLWGYNILAHYPLGSGSIPVGPGIGQLDGRGGPDIVVGARDSHDATDFSNDHALLLALDSGGKVLWAAQDPEGNPLTYTHPIVVDAAGDGTNEVYWGDWNTIGHKPPDDDAEAWKVTGPAHYYRYSETGALVWKQTLSTYWSNKDLALADVDADGVQEVLANGPGSGGDGVWYLDSRTGAKEAFVSTHPWKVSRGPVVADLHGAGTMQWVVPAEAATDAVSGGAILVYDTGVPYDSVYPHLPYPTVGAAPPPPAGCFETTYTIKAPNAWWQELYVPSTHAVTSAEVRIDGGAWRPMAKSSWGAWTSSYHAVAGARVEFSLRDAGDAASQSQPFTWLDGSLSRPSVACDGSSPPPPPSPFAATYKVAAGSNEWWVEVGVQSDQIVSLVEARADGGAWRSLALQSWGTWARSFFVAACSEVEFRATATSGAQDTSSAVAWLDDGSCGDAAPFAATFTPKAVGNDWWVETLVQANHPVVAVDARIDGGAWVSLPRQSWGGWAKSIHVPDGSTIQFRAFDAAGASVQSTSYVWP